MKIKIDQKTMANFERGWFIEQMQNKKCSFSLYIIGNELCFDKVMVATHFNDFFTSNAASLVDNLPACSGQFGQSHVVECYRNKHVT